MTNETQFFRKIYVSLYSKGLRKSYVWEVSWRLNKDCNILTPSSFVFSSISFSFCWAAQPGGLSFQLSAGSGPHCLELQQLTPNSKLTRTSCGTGLYNCLTYTCFSERHICTQLNPSTVKVIPWYLRPDAPVIYTDTFLIWQLGRTGGQYVTLIAAQNNTIRANHIKVRIDKTQQNNKCKFCGDRDDPIKHTISQSSKLALKEYKTRNDWVGKMIH